MFFSNKIAAAVAWHEGNQQAALNAYSMARNEWAGFANLAKGKYSDDITYGTVRHMRGHWLDRLADIDGDIEDMKKNPPPQPAATIGAMGGTISHTPPPRFRPGRDLEILAEGTGGQLFYRHVNQAERWRTVATEKHGEGVIRAIIPGEYTNSAFAIQYYFANHQAYPGFGPDHAGTPYYVVRPA